jgi:hypothetical protein
MSNSLATAHKMSSLFDIFGAFYCKALVLCQAAV